MEIYIHGMAVERAHRCRGITNRLVPRLQSLAGKMGIHVLFVQADHGNDPSIALYSTWSITEEFLHFYIPVKAAGWRDD